MPKRAVKKVASPAQSPNAPPIRRDYESVVSPVFYPLLVLLLVGIGYATYQHWQLQKEPAAVSVRFAAKVKTFADVAEGYSSVFALAADKIANGEIKSAEDLSKYATPLNTAAREQAQATYRNDWNATVPDSKFEDPQAVAKSVRDHSESWHQLSVELRKIISQER